MSQDHYKVLGVARTATQEEIKNAYRELARKLHPDMNRDDPNAEDRFKAVTVAYDVLGNETKRAEYDADRRAEAAASSRSRSQPPPRPQRGGAAGAKTASPSSHSNPMSGLGFGGVMDDFVNDLLRGGGGRAAASASSGVKPGTSGTRTNAASSDSAASEIPIELTIEEAFAGGQKRQRIEIEGKCTGCNGSGISQKNRIGLNIGTSCAACRGSGRRRHQEEVSVTIPPGVYEGAKLRLRGKGPINANGEPGELILVVHLQQHARYTAEGRDIVIELTVPYTVLVLGGEMPVEGPGGKTTLTVPEGTQPGAKLRIAGKGMPALGNRPQGDLVARIVAGVPKTVSTQERALLRELAKLRNDPVRP